MSTISKEIAMQIMDGMYPEDQVTKIVSYRNMWDGFTIAAVYAMDRDQNKYENSPACRQVETLFIDGKLTMFGAGYFHEEIMAGKLNDAVLPSTGAEALKNTIIHARQRRTGEL